MLGNNAQLRVQMVKSLLVTPPFSMLRFTTCTGMEYVAHVVICKYEVIVLHEFMFEYITSDISAPSHSRRNTFHCVVHALISENFRFFIGIFIVHITSPIGACTIYLGYWCMHRFLRRTSMRGKRVQLRPRLHLVIAITWKRGQFIANFHFLCLFYYQVLRLAPCLTPKPPGEPDINPKM